MKHYTKHCTRQEYWKEIDSLFCIGDSLTMVNGEDGLDEIIEFRNSSGCLLSSFNVDKEIMIQY